MWDRKLYLVQWHGLDESDERNKTAMNARERFHEVMNFNADVATMKWEFGYWGGNRGSVVRGGFAEASLS